MGKSRNSETHRGVAQGLRCLLLGVVALLLAAPAWAATVVNVRVGQHAGYSRLVFELDAPVGYKVERHAPSAGTQELVVSLDAAAKSQTVRGKLDFIESVEITSESSRRSTVRVRLKGDDLKLKEMILANPPRIVLDVLNEGAIAKAKQAEKDRARAALAKKKAAAKSVAKVEPKPAPKTEPTPVAKAPAPKPAERFVPASKSKPAPPSPGETARAGDMGAATPQPPASLPGNARAAGAPQQLALAPNAAPTARSNRNTGANAMPPSAVQPRATYPTPNPAASPVPRPAATARPQALPTQPTATPRPKAALPASATPPDGEGFFNITNITVGALGLVLLVGAGFIFMRRRIAAEVVDASAFENPLGDDNPFAGLDPETNATDAEADPFATGPVGDADTEEIAIPEATLAEAGIEIPEPITTEAQAAGEAPVQEGNDMDMVSDNAQTTIMDSPHMPAAGGDDVSRMVAEFERRMKAMETRMDELVDAKERLERQVAAQTEELRVQRAAIARTQRAVRNLSRPGEDSPTEPALRDPSRPEGPRQ